MHSEHLRISTLIAFTVAFVVLFIPLWAQQAPVSNPAGTTAGPPEKPPDPPVDTGTTLGPPTPIVTGAAAASPAMVLDTQKVLTSVDSRTAEGSSQQNGSLPKTNGHTLELMMVGLLALAAASGLWMHRKQVHRALVSAVPGGTGGGGE